VEPPDFAMPAVSCFMAAVSLAIPPVLVLPPMLPPPAPPIAVSLAVPAGAGAIAAPAESVVVFAWSFLPHAATVSTAARTASFLMPSSE
jgi:hypothetical protein